MPIPFDSGDASGSIVVDPGRALCARFVDELPVSGASISVVTATGTHSVIGASDPLAAELEGRQFELGIGPHWEALRTGLPATLYTSQGDPAPTLWQQLEGDAVIGEAAALFAFPLQLGAATVGVADLYSRSTVEHWTDEVIQRARAVAAELATAAVRLATSSAEAATSTTGQDAVELRREVHQATGMVMARLQCSAGTALVRLRAHAFATGIPLDALARTITARRFDYADL